jgi:hypothetical protein
MCREQGYDLQTVQALRSLALAHHGLGAATRPLEWTLEALELAIGLELRPEQGRSHAALAEIHSDRGEETEAARHLQAARAIAASMGLPFPLATDGV